MVNLFIKTAAGYYKALSITEIAISGHQFRLTIIIQVQMMNLINSISFSTIDKQVLRHQLRCITLMHLELQESADFSGWWLTIFLTTSRFDFNGLLNFFDHAELF